MPTIWLEHRGAPLENSHSLEAEAWTPVQNAFSVKLPFKWVMMQSKLTIGTSEDDVCSDMDEGIQPVYKTVAIQKQKHSCIKYEEDLDESEDEVETHLTNSTPSLRHLLYLILQQWSPDWGSGNLNKATPMDGSNKAGPSGPNQSTSLELSTSTVPALKEWRPNWALTPRDWIELGNVWNGDEYLTRTRNE
ncbi:hypothetical protein BT96DRAFT_944699 [Gymnopus androsaceus JB14]|uniref:Uncharacterized protein n=1 Tax=Gymnopus androsaceus JB14 TaxID=1447944 RepID=A0A6A4H4X3_9AGAR|nr:hypothetical protein BT96DRAFT_944699 [Gymnopus androsaceus JB14]